MDTHAAPGPAVAAPGRAGRDLPARIASLADAAVPPGAALAEAVARAAEAGFDAVILPCPFALRDGLLAEARVERPDAAPAGASGDILRLATLPVGAVASGSALHAADRAAYREPDRAALRDPRLALDTGTARLADDPAATAAHAAMLAGLLREAGRAGFDGAVLTGLDRLAPEAARALLEGLREAAGEALLVADFRGVSRVVVAALPAGAVDLAIGSSAFWDWRADWLPDEARALAAVAPVLLPAPVLPPETAAATLSRARGLALALGHGWIVPLDAAASADPDALAALNRAPPLSGAVTALSAPGAAVLASLRTATPDPRAAERATLVLVNAGTAAPAELEPAGLLSRIGFPFDGFRPAGGGPALLPGTPVVLAPGEAAILHATRIAPPAHAPLDPASALRASRELPRIGLEDPQPTVDGGRFTVRRVAGESVAVEVDLVSDGHDKLACAVQWREAGATEFTEARLLPLGNDRWGGRFPLPRMGSYEFRFAAWWDVFETFRDELGKKHNAGVDVTLELREGRLMVEGRLPGHPVTTALAAAAADPDRAREILLDAATRREMDRADPRPHLAETRWFPVDAERAGAATAAWYEVFPRSMSDDPDRHGTFRDVERHLPRIRAMGFDVLYFPPIHPIGRINRKGPNNTLTPGPDDPGSPYAIGSVEGGHDAVHPELGTLDEFRHLIGAAHAHGLEIAIDFAIQCSPDHPWLREHRDWFHWRPDGSIRYAENPPKKYQDIVNVDFYADGAIPSLWLELAQVVLFWCETGVRLFRVDNPHTKAFPFWEWMIREIRARHPDAVFLAEAFTRPKIMARLAKIGFSQSYTYFTWRETPAELAQYLGELNEKPLADIFRPHFFVNTPDINPLYLQGAPRSAFLIRAALAATLSGLWGVYSGFELCEGTPLAPGKEEYFDSEKYQIRAWDWDRPGNIVPEITRLNAVRRENPALQTHLGVHFLPSGNARLLFFEKADPERRNVLWIAVSFDPRDACEGVIELPLWRQGLPDSATVTLDNLVGGDRFTLSGKHQTLRLSADAPYAIWRLARDA